MSLLVALGLVLLTGWLVTRGALDARPPILSGSEAAPDGPRAVVSAPRPGDRFDAPDQNPFTPLGFRADAVGGRVDLPSAPRVTPVTAGPVGQTGGVGAEAGGPELEAEALGRVSAADAPALSGRLVVLEDARVVERVGPRVMRVELSGAAAGAAEASANEAAAPRTALVVLPARLASEVRTGDAVTLRGTLQPMPGVTEGRGGDLPGGLVILASELTVVQ